MTEAIFVSDMHLAHKPPIARSSESDWYGRQAEYLLQLVKLSNKGKIPIICTGDVFDRWNAPAELINFALAKLPHLYAIPGNHDLPHHNYEAIQRSAYWTLVQAGKITNILPQQPVNILPGLCLHGFPYGHSVTPYRGPKSSLVLDIAVVHEYIWNASTGFQGAPEDKAVWNFRKRCQGFDLVAVGDNHKPFYSQTGSPPIVNCGGFMRRTIDESEHQPRVYLLQKGAFVPEYLDISKDAKLLDSRELGISGKDKAIIDFVRTMKGRLEIQKLDFASALADLLETLEPEVRKILVTLMEDDGN